MTQSKPSSLTSSNHTHNAPNTLPDDAATHDEENVATESPATDSASNKFTRGRGWQADLCDDKCFSEDLEEPSACTHEGQLNTNFTTSGFRTVVGSNKSTVLFFPDSVLGTSLPKESTAMGASIEQVDEEGVAVVVTVGGKRIAMFMPDNDDLDLQKPTPVYEPGEEPQTLTWTQFDFRAEQNP